MEQLLEVLQIQNDAIKTMNEEIKYLKNAVYVLTRGLEAQRIVIEQLDDEILGLKAELIKK